VFDKESTFRYTQTVAPDWRFGGGSNGLGSSTTSPPAKHITIDPNEPDRPARLNYKLLISAVVPRPIAFVSTRSADGTTTNLAPFSYFQMIAHDPPLFIVGFSTPLGVAKTRDTLKNLSETGECVINIISEHYAEAANSTSINAPYGISEWEVSGLTPVHDCVNVKCARVGEAIFSIEGKLESLREFESRAKPGEKTSTLAIIEGVKFWVREDAVDDEKSMVDTEVGAIFPCASLRTSN
jgi:flavin reductase (DIM6/NTAB) family NADH-FMN oxidoreductase RutF